MRRGDGELYFSNVRAGLIVALLSIGTLFGALVGGPIADVIGRKPSVILWCGIFCVGNIVMIAADDKWYQVMLGRLVQVSMRAVSYRLADRIGFWGWCPESACPHLHGRDRTSPYQRFPDLHISAL